MSKRKFGAPHRQAIWLAYGRKCFYCRDPLAWDDLQIDHVVPERLAESDEQRRALFRDLAIPDDWDLQADANLVASCSRCNSDKLALVPSPNQMMILLAQAGAKASRVSELRAGCEKGQRTQLLLARLETALALGHVQVEEVERIRRAVDAEPDAPVRFGSSLEFLGDIVLNELRPSEVEPFFDKPVRLGADLPEGVELVRERDGMRESCNVKTAREYTGAIEQGFFPYTTFAEKMSAFFIRTVGVLTAIQACRPAARSFIQEPRVGLCDLHLLPSSLLGVWGPDEEGIAMAKASATIEALVRAGHAKVVTVTSHAFEIEFRNLYTSCREMLRADLDGDGYEELLASRYIRAVGGSFGAASQPVALSRRGLAEPLILTEIVPVREEAE
jgi:hypothetical protein